MAGKQPAGEPAQQHHNSCRLGRAAAGKLYKRQASAMPSHGAAQCLDVWARQCIVLEMLVIDAELQPCVWCMQVPTERLQLSDAVRIAVYQALQVIHRVWVTSNSQIPAKSHVTCRSNLSMLPHSALSSDVQQVRHCGCTVAMLQPPCLVSGCQ